MPNYCVSLKLEQDTITGTCAPFPVFSHKNVEQLPLPGHSHLHGGLITIWQVHAPSPRLLQSTRAHEQTHKGEKQFQKALQLAVQLLSPGELLPLPHMWSLWDV